MQLTGNYTLMMVDADIVGAPADNNTRHWLVNGASVSGNALSNSSASAPEPYAGPLPATGSGAHRYVLLLLEQPANFSSPADLAPGIVKIDLAQYIQVCLGPWSVPEHHSRVRLAVKQLGRRRRRHIHAGSGRRVVGQRLRDLRRRDVDPRRRAVERVGRVQRFLIRCKCLADVQVFGRRTSVGLWPRARACVRSGGPLSACLCPARLYHTLIVSSAR